MNAEKPPYSPGVPSQNNPSTSADQHPQTNTTQQDTRPDTSNNQKLMDWASLIGFAIALVVAAVLFHLWRKSEDKRKEAEERLRNEVNHPEEDLRKAEQARAETERTKNETARILANLNAARASAAKEKSEAEAACARTTEEHQKLRQETAIAERLKKEGEAKIAEAKSIADAASKDRRAAEHALGQAVEERLKAEQIRADAEQAKSRAIQLHQDAETIRFEAQALMARAKSRLIPATLHGGELGSLLEELMKAPDSSLLAELALARIHQVTGLIPLTDAARNDARLAALHTALRDLGHTLAEWLNARHDPIAAAKALAQIANVYNTCAQGRYELRAIKTGDAYDGDMMEATPRPESVSLVKGWAVFTGKGARVSRASVN